MRLKVFSFASPYFSWSWKLDAAEVQSAVSAWLKTNSGVVVREIKHDAIASFWYPPQLFVSIYYEDAPQAEPDVQDVTSGV